MNFQKYSDNFIEKTILRFISKKITPNQITWLRIISLPFIYYLLKNESYGWGLIIFFLAATTDALDGALARKRDQITELGKVLDPIADKGLIFLVAITFIPKLFGWYLLYAIIFLELLNALMAYVSNRRTGVNHGANWAGKTKMVIQSVAFMFIFISILEHNYFYAELAEVFLYTSLIFTFLQVFIYPKKNNA